MSRYFRKVAGQSRDRGASAVEYGLMVAAIAAVIVAVVFGLGGLVRNTFDETCTEIIAGNADDVNQPGAGGDCGADDAPPPGGG